MSACEVNQHGNTTEINQSQIHHTHYFLLTCALFLSNAIFISGRSRPKGPTYQPHSQGLSSLPPLVVGRKPLVAAGHVTTQNLGGKKICWVRVVAEYFVWLCDKLCGFQIV